LGYQHYPNDGAFYWQEAGALIALGRLGEVDGLILRCGKASLRSGSLGGLLYHASRELGRTGTRMPRPRRARAVNFSLHNRRFSRAGASAGSIATARVSVASACLPRWYPTVPRLKIAGAYAGQMPIVRAV
jgi:hypothetical protein